MAKVVIIGAGFAGHTAALYLGDALGKNHEITVVNRQDYFLFIPSLVWVGIDKMNPNKTNFKLEQVYRKKNVKLVVGKATEVHPDDQFVLVEKETDKSEVKLDYDYLLIATGPKLNFEATPGLGPKHGNTYSICSLPHAEETRDAYLEICEKMKQGEKQKIVIGTGHGGATCQGATLEYITNIHKDLVARGIRDKAELHYHSNEVKVGDFGVRGVVAKYKNKLISSEEFIEAVYKDFDISYAIQRATKEVTNNQIHWEDYDGNFGETNFDFTMLVPQFTGQPFKYVGKDGSDVKDKIANPAGFIKVDGIYGLPNDELIKTPEAWPAVYQNGNYDNIFAGGIAFAPPGPISAPHKTKNGTVITAAPPRTGMVSGIIGRLIAQNIIDLIKHGKMTHSERMTEMYAACIASMGDSLWDGSAATIVVYPVVPNLKKYPHQNGRDRFVTHMEMGLSGAWLKRLLHTTFMHKFQARPGWKIIPE